MAQKVNKQAAIFGQTNQIFRHKNPFYFSCENQPMAFESNTLWTLQRKGGTTERAYERKVGLHFNEIKDGERNRGLLTEARVIG